MPRPYPGQGLAVKLSKMDIPLHVGNVLIDALMMQWYGKEFDQDGRIVRIVTPSSTLFSRLMNLLPHRLPLARYPLCC